MRPITGRLLGGIVQAGSAIVAVSLLRSRWAGMVHEMVQQAELLVKPMQGDPFRFSMNKDVISIGRSKRNDLVFSDQWLARHHAEIRLEDVRFVLEDFQTKNGTYVNGERIDSPVQLEHNDIITLGDQQLTFIL